MSSFDATVKESNQNAYGKIISSVDQCLPRSQKQRSHLHAYLHPSKDVLSSSAILFCLLNSGDKSSDPDMQIAVMQVTQYIFVLVTNAITEVINSNALQTNVI